MAKLECAVRLTGFLLAAISACVIDAQAGGDLAAGKKQAAAMCRVCHGLDGIAKLPDAPNLAGQNELYLVRSLTAYKTGERKNPQMSVVAPTLGEEDIANLAAYYASIKIAVQEP
ncbi:c-type cytochrome [Allomesorhizobium alhagi]|jgi:cytochrome c553|uniref:Cytochrome c class I n=1 Tax=Mesorhizobium alhagi CCNWXJ12-2 TaxID=1107882 RepID=H0HTH6_9HYPH|nr:cytochrome c [Mesorhizobium alhagi]EHK55954.1 cytochrome c class I [Mesorhizobium alhagi CCNWXJ12-2]